MTAPTIPVTLSTASVYPRRAPFAFEVAAQIGYDGVEVMVWSDPVTQDPRALQRLSADTGMPIRSIHAPTLLVSQRVWGRSPAEKLARTVDMAAELGARTVVVHPPFRWQYRYARGFEEQVQELNASGDVVVAVENMYPWRPHSRLDRELKAYLPGWDPSEHGYDSVTLDLSHAAIAQQDGMELLDEFGDRLRHVHLADGTFNARDEHLVPGRGTQPCAEFLEGLAGRGFDGLVVVEVNTRKADDRAEREADLAEALAFTRLNLAAPLELDTSAFRR
jgi:sugar phosphate isomerase/epimerase